MLETISFDIQANTDKAERSFRALDNVAKNFGRQITASLGDAVLKGEKLDDVFKSLALSIANTALKAGLQPLQNSLSSGFSGIFSNFLGGGLSGGGASGGSPVPFARGGVVASPSFFPLNQGFGMAGEAGPEAIIPLSRGPDGRLGVASNAQSGAQNITVNISTPDINSFRQSEAQVSTTLARALRRSRRSN